MPTRAERRAANRARWRMRHNRPGSLAGRYKGPHREWTLTWLPESSDYRRDFDNDSRWTWDEARTWSTAEVVAEVAAGRWTPLRRPSGP